MVKKKKKVTNIRNAFNKPKISNMTRPEGAGNYDNMDDYNIVQSIDLVEGTKQLAPVLPKDIVNKEYVDSVAGGGAITNLDGGDADDNYVAVGLSLIDGGTA